MSNLTLADVLNERADMKETENGMLAYSVKTLDDMVRWFYLVNDNLTKANDHRKFTHENSPYIIVHTQVSNEIVDAYEKAIEAKDEETLHRLNRFMAFLRDPRHGLGQRNLFRAVASRVMHPTANLDAVVNHGRWDDLIAIEHHNRNGFVSDEICSKVLKQLAEDFANEKENKPVSLLGKWMPSANTSSKETKKVAKKWAKILEVNEAKYRKILSSLRKRIDITEHYLDPSDMSGLDYSKVPSNAMNRYMNQFRHHDHDRFCEYMEKVANGEEKVNMDTNTVVDVYAKVYNDVLNSAEENTLLKEMFKQMTGEGDPNVEYLPVIDVSGSMNAPITSTITSSTVAQAIGIMLAKRNKGIFKDLAIAFSDDAKVVRFETDDVYQNCHEILQHQDYGSTDIGSVFEMLASYVESNNLPKDSIPTLVVITDCEFNECSYGRYGFYNPCGDNRMASYRKFLEDKGIKSPRVIFWNTQARSGTIPVKDDGENQITYVSGFSTNILDAIANGDCDTKAWLLEKLKEGTWDDADHLLI